MNVYEQIKQKLLNFRFVAVVVIIAVGLIGGYKVIEAIFGIGDHIRPIVNTLKPSTPPQYQVNSKDEGVAELVFTFSDPPKDLVIDKASLQISNASLKVVPGAASKQVQVVKYCVLVPWDTAALNQTTLTQKHLGFYHDINEPIARLKLVLWYEGSGSDVEEQLTFDVKPVLFDENQQALPYDLPVKSVSLKWSPYIRADQNCDDN